jgi:hypothetical protein
MNKFLDTLLFFILVFNGYSQSGFTRQLPDSSGNARPLIDVAGKERVVNLRDFAIPAALMTYGIVAISIDSLNEFDEEVKEMLWVGRKQADLQIDDYLQHAPAVSVYLLNAMGIKGKHNFRDRTAIYLLSNFLVNNVAHPVKRLARRNRPDASDFESFPSLHTARAFANAEFLRVEFKDVSPWYGIAGYTIAAATGYLRIYNNKHWLSDIVAGAGLGILSTKIAYWLYAKIGKLVFDKRSETSVLKGY